jgi:hypothetical protein
MPLLSQQEGGATVDERLCRHLEEELTTRVLVVPVKQTVTYRASVEPV